MDHMDLEDDQKEKLRQFTEFTHMHDYEVAVGTLASLNWNLEQAIEAHLMQDTEDMQDDPEIIETVPPPRTGPSNRAPDIIDIDHSVSTRTRRRRNQEETVDNQIDDSRMSNNEPPRRGDPIPRHGRRAPEMSSGPVGASASSSNRRRGNNAAPLGVSQQQQPAHPVPARVRHNGQPVFQIDSDDDDDMHVVYDDDDHGPALDIQQSARSNGRAPMIPDNYESVPDALQNFVATFRSRFCSTPSTQAFIPPFYTDPLPNAIHEAFENRDSDRRRPLVFYINHDRSIASNIFASQVLCSEPVWNLLRHQYVLFPWDISSETNLLRFMEFLQAANMVEMRSMVQRFATGRIEAFPMMAVVIKDGSSYRLVDYCRGTDTCDQVLEKLVSGVDEYSRIRLNEATARREREEREAIRNQQEAEYQASLMADTARIEAKQREIDQQKREEEEKLRAVEEEEMRRQLIASALPSEPAATDADIINIKFRLPEGGQDLRRFRKAEPIQTVIDYLSSKGFSPDKFKYFNSDFPKKEITGAFDLSAKFSEAKWPAREQIFVEEI